MKKKYFVIIFSISLFFVVLIWILIYRSGVREQNVFDQMYCTRVHTDFDWWSSKNYRGLFRNMEQLENISRDNEDSYTNYGNFVESYKADCLKNGAELKITIVSKPEKKVRIIYRTDLSETKNEKYDSDYKWYYYVYDVNDKILTYTTNDPENKEKDFLYTILLKDWFEANPNTKFSLDNLGEFKLIEETAVAD